ncbi:helix-turn-helix transcriptional regulator [Paenibacillus sp.]|uniref:helix-turn-helix domain-containing protein n=1 Tax=Paenibacillus sp. TaxID=58172 RepID=UPI002D3DC38C|nr:helix-turn-helix transcriptional regulator [Paenibacillus sp.]HZG88145.1 helix-turn-helix transcriptional regulator [Paenibacillus sp.]
MITLLAKDIFDAEAEVHYACHKSLSTVTGLHDHDFYELFLVSHGTLVHIANGQRAVLGEGSFVFVRPSDAHCYEAPVGRPGTLWNLAFPVRLVEAVRQYLGEGFDLDRLTQGDAPPAVTLSPPDCDRLLARFQALTLLPAANKARIKAEARAMIADAFMRHFAAEPHRGGEPMPVWLEQLVRAMKTKECFVSGIARLHELSPKSPEHLSRSFKKYLGLTPTQWITEARLQYAGNLLTYTDEPVVSVCFECGFENVSHFNHQFKRFFGVSPSVYRKRNQTTLIPQR